MTNRYRVLTAPASWPESLPFRIHTADGEYGVGDEFDHEFTEADETANLASGLLEVVPRSYRVVGDSIVHDTAKGATFEAALTMFEEAHLVAGGHIERAEDPAPAVPGTTKPRASRKPKEA